MGNPLTVFELQSIEIDGRGPRAWRAVDVEFSWDRADQDEARTKPGLKPGKSP